MARNIVGPTLFSLVIIAGLLTTFKGETELFYHHHSYRQFGPQLGGNFWPVTGMAVLASGLILILLGFLLAVILAQVFSGKSGKGPL